MRWNFRSKFLAIVGTTAIAFLLLIVASTLLTRRVSGQVEKIRDTYVPRVELQPKLQGLFETIGRGFQDAVAARDPESLAKTQEVKAEFLRRLAEAHGAIDAAHADALRGAFEDYYATALDVSRRLIAGETGEPVVEAMGKMQAKQRQAADALALATAFEKDELATAFASVEEQMLTAANARLAITAACMLVVLALSYLIGRGMVGAAAEVAAGIERFGANNFTQPIRLLGNDELTDVARQANKMANSLLHYSEERARVDWQKSGLAGLVQELRGELEPQEAASRAVTFLARYLGAPAAALYYQQKAGKLQLLGSFAQQPLALGKVVPCFDFGEGLVGQAALRDEPLVISEPPADYLRIRSGLGESPPKSLVLLPLAHVGKTRGVLELALFKPWSDEARELLKVVREPMTIAIEVALARSETQALLTKTQAQAARLTVQEEQLRSTNEELQAQQEELRQTNEELTQQAEELEMQRRLLQEKISELERVRNTLEEKTEELTTVSAYKSQFLTNMSHELRTPLNSMLLLSNLLAENEQGNLTEKQIEFSKTIHAAGKDLLALINQVLDLAKIEAGRQEVRLSQVQLTTLADRARRFFEPIAKDKRLGFSVQVEPGLPESIFTDHQRVDQVLTNLLGNALKFTEVGEVSLRIAKPAADAVFHREGLKASQLIAFEVKDTGPGIAPEHRERVFAPFEQVEGKSDRRYGGTGLGLAIARELVSLLGGELQLHSAVGKGSTFTCYLPVESRPTARAVQVSAPLSDAHPGSVARAAAAVPRGAAGENGDDRAGLKDGEPYLLIIEDDPLFAQTFGDVIRGQGLKYVWEQTAEGGLAQAQARPPAGIILDVKLPGTDGFQVMQKLRADLRTQAIPVHFASAVDAAERGMALGAAGYLTKPASKRDLIRAIHSLVPKLTTQPRGLLVVEDDDLSAESLMKLLNAEGVEARHVPSAQAALAALEKERFGCMILDLSLPDMDGLDLLEKVQQQCGADMPSVVIYTGRALSRGEAKRLEAYAQAIVLKEGPSAERLLNEVRLFGRRLKQELRPRQAEPPRFRSSDVRLEGRRILVVDDDMRTVYALSATLRAKGAVVKVGDTGKAGVEMLMANPDIEAVLMDIMMPEMDGYEAMRRMRADARFCKLPIVALTAKAMKGDEEKCLEAGASDYLPKPIDSDRLLSLLDARLNPKTP